MKQVCHHIDIYEPPQTSLNFSRYIGGKMGYFAFTVFPFGLQDPSKIWDPFKKLTGLGIDVDLK